MPTQRFERLDFEKRATILEAAGRQFADHGYDGESLDHILEDAGISKTQAYYYFENKADLFLCVAEHYVNRVLEETDEFYANAGPSLDWEALRRMVRDATRRDYDAHEILHSLEVAVELSPELSADPAVRAQFDRVHDAMDGLFRRGQEAGVVRTDLPFDLLRSLYHAMHDASSRWWVRNRQDLSTDEEARVSDKLFDLMEAVLRPPGKGDPGRRAP